MVIEILQCVSTAALGITAYSLGKTSERLRMMKAYRKSADESDWRFKNESPALQLAVLDFRMRMLNHMYGGNKYERLVEKELKKNGPGHNL